PPSVFSAAAARLLSPLSLHDALSISRSLRWVCRSWNYLREITKSGPAEISWLERRWPRRAGRNGSGGGTVRENFAAGRRFACNRDRQSTRLNSSHQIISYAVFCLTKK